VWRAAAAGFGDPELDEDGAASLRQALETSGARTSFEAEIRRERDQAVRLIQTAGLPAELERALCRAADQAMERRA
jgi:hypothetical protein